MRPIDTRPCASGNSVSAPGTAIATSTSPNSTERPGKRRSAST